MDDQQIIALYFARSEHAIAATQQKYGRYCYAVAYNILGDREDARECENDTYLRAWNSMPPNRPAHLAAYLAKITRNLALNVAKRQNTQKRGQGQKELALSELADCVADPAPAQGDEKALVQALETFLHAQTAEKRKIFLRRYWYFSPIREIAHEFSMSESKLTSLLFRMRNDLKAHLKKEGLYDE